MLYVNKCVKCGKEYQSLCGEYTLYTKKGWEARKRQLEAGLCESCFGETPERGDYEHSPAPEAN